MPSYVVTTDQGKFKVNLDKTPASQEELMSLVQDALANGLTKTESKSTAAPTRRPEGFGETLTTEASAGASDVAEGVRRALSGGTRDIALGSIQAIGGGLRVAGSPITATGAVAGESTQDVANALGAENLEARLGLPNQSISAGLATAADLGTQLYGLPKLIGKGVTAAVSKLASPMAKKYGAEASKIVNLEREFEIPTTAAQRTGSSALAQAEALPTRFPVGSQPILDFGRKQEGASRKAVQKIGTEISPESMSVEEAGHLLKSRYSEASDAARQATNKAYDAVKGAVPDTELFETPALMKGSQQLDKEATAAKGILKTKAEGIASDIEAAIQPSGKRLPSDVSEYASDVSPGFLDLIKSKYGAIDNPNRMMTFEGMDLLRKDLRDILRSAKKSGKDNEVRQVAVLIDGLTDDMRETASRFPNAFQLLEKADKQFHSEVVPYFTKGKFPRVLSEKDASQITKTLIWGNRDHPENIELVKRAINKSDEFNKIVRSWWEDLFQKSMDPKTEIFSTQRFLTNYNRFTPEVRKSLLGPNAEKADRLGDLFEAIGRANAMGVNPSQTARGVLGAAQGLGALKIVTDVGTGNLPAAIKGGAILLSPLAIGKILTSPRGIELLSTGIQIAPGTKEALTIGPQLVALANAAMSKSAIRDFLQDDTTSIEDKISAALGNNFRDSSEVARKVRSRLEANP